MTVHRILQPGGWPRPSGYSNGIVAKGPTVVLAGQIGWDAIMKNTTSESEKTPRKGFELMLVSLMRLF